MKILYLIGERPLTPNGFGGASALFYGHVRLLASSGHEIVLGLLSDKRSAPIFQDYCERHPAAWRDINEWTAGIRHVELAPLPRARSFIQVLQRSITQPALSVQSVVWSKNAQAVRDLDAELQPDLIWADGVLSALICRAAGLQDKMVYGHLDWRYRIKKLRFSTAGKRAKGDFKYLQMRRAEHDLVRTARACLCASPTEAQDALNLGTRLVGYCPASYEPVELPATAPDAAPRLVHLGGMQTTATRQGLERFFDVVWPRLKETMPELPELWVIGDLDGASPQLRKYLEQQGVVCTGFVRDLGEIMHQNDIHLIPWEYATGTRTRLGVALNYAQVIVTPRAAALATPEICDQKDCVLVDTLEDMAPAIAELCSSPERRRELGKAARQTFMRYFTHESQKEPFHRFVEACLTGQKQKHIMSCTIPLEGVTLEAAQ